MPVYDSPERRNADIDETASLADGELRELSFAACDRWKEAIAAVTDWDALMERVPGGPSFSAVECIDMRWREVEIHHADLGVGYTAADWPPAFTTYLLGYLAADRSEDLTLRTPTRELTVGAGGPVVEGSGTRNAIVEQAGELAFGSPRALDGPDIEPELAQAMRFEAGVFGLSIAFHAF